jgi:hypothetical protein
VLISLLRRVDLGLPYMQYPKMREAIAAFNHDPATQEWSDALDDGQQIILQGTHLRDLLLKSFSPAPQAAHAHVALQASDDISYPSLEKLNHDSRIRGQHGGAFSGNQFIHSWVRRYCRPDPLRVEGDPDLNGLNATQVRAIALMLGERLSLVQGVRPPVFYLQGRLSFPFTQPPGTGKTRTIIETIRLLKQHFQVPHPLLICTFTNVAVDNLVEGIVATGLSPIRVGHMPGIKPSLLQYSLQAQLEAHPLNKDLKKLQDEQDGLRIQVRNFSAKIAKLQDATTPKAISSLEHYRNVRDSLERRIGNAQAKEHALQQTMISDILGKADVVCRLCNDLRPPLILHFCRFVQLVLVLRALRCERWISLSCLSMRLLCRPSQRH